MAGATATILFPSATYGVVESWERIVAARAHTLRGADFWLAPPAVGAGALGFFSRVVRREDPDWPLAAEEDQLVLAGFEFTPELAIAIGAIGRGVESDRVLGELALSLLDVHTGVLQFDGLLAPTLDPEAWRRCNAQSPRERMSLFHDAVGAFAGRKVAAFRDGEPASHVVDRDFLAYWLTHGAFHFPN